MELENIRKRSMQMILQFSIPAIIAMVLSSMVSLVDGFFIGNYVGKEGLAAVNLGLPVLYLYLGIGIMLGVGGTACAGILMGAGELKKSSSVFNQTMAMTLGIMAVLSVVVALGFKPFLSVLNCDPTVTKCFMEYYGIMVIVYPFLVINSNFGMFIRGEGNPQYFMQGSILVLILNIVLDYVFVRLLQLGIKGVAYASLIACVLGTIFMVRFFYTKAKIYKIEKFHYDRLTAKNILFNGSSEFIGEMSMGISMFAYNWVILRYAGVDGVAAFTVIGYVEYIFGMIIIGFGQGASPMMSFTFGAKEPELCRTIRKKTNRCVFFTGVVTLVLMLLCNHWYSGLFVKNEDVRLLISQGIWLFVWSFLFSGINTITSFYFTSIGKAKESAVISSARGLVVLLVCIFLLPVFFGMNGIWMSAPITEFITILISLYYIRGEGVGRNLSMQPNGAA